MRWDVFVQGDSAGGSKLTEQTLNLITVMVINMETIWRCMESDTFYGDFMVKLVWRLSGENMVNQITRLISILILP